MNIDQRARFFFGFVTAGVAAVGLLGLPSCSGVQCQDNGTCSPPAGETCHESNGVLVCASDDAGIDSTTLDANTLGDGGDSAPQTDTGADSATCNGSQAPSQSSCTVTSRFGIFASPRGADSNPGTQASPVASVGHAMDLAKAQGKRVYACGTAGSYVESLMVGASRDGVAVYGGFDCSSWAYSASTPATVAPTAVGYALQATGLTTGVTFEDFGFQAPAGVQPGDSSIAVFVNGSSHVLIERCALVAQAAQPGVDATTASPFASPAPTGQAGTADAGGPATPNTCAGIANASVGGAGGAPSTNGTDGDPGTPGPANGDTLPGGGCASGVQTAGANGSGGSAGQGAQSAATLTSSGWAPMAGAPGGVGGVGQGGGGGASVDTTGGGGGGGAGGCGGAGGAAGTGGGSSLALLAFQSTVDLEQCTLSAANAGRGGNGANGQVGQTRGNGGSSGACTGGRGGYGGSGGGGGGGAGGLSAGIVWSGTAPTVNGTPTSQESSLANVTLGTLGPAGQPGAGAAAPVASANAGTDAPNNAIAGVAGAVVMLP